MNGGHWLAQRSYFRRITGQSFLIRQARANIAELQGLILHHLSNFYLNSELSLNLQMIPSSELLQTPSRVETPFKGSKKCKRETKQDPAWENEGKITQSSYSWSNSSLRSKAQSPTLHLHQKASDWGDHPKMCKRQIWSPASCHGPL